MPEESPGRARQCRDQGYLVAVDQWLPADPREFFEACFGIFAVGCNGLRCGFCGKPVREALGRWSAETGSDPRTLYATTSWAQASEGLFGRLYACACFASVVHAPVSVLPDEDAIEIGPSRWRCAGHPTLVLPGDFEDIALGRETDWDAVVGARLGSAGVPPLHPTLDRHPGFLLVRIYQALAEGSARDELSQAVSVRCRSPRLAERAGVALFFAQQPLARGFDAVLEAWLETPGLYDGVAAPWGPEPDLRGVLLRAIVFRLGAEPRRDDPVALSALRRAATTHPGLRSKVLHMPALDADWAAENLESLVAAAPGDWETILRTVRTARADALAAACQTAVRSGSVSAEDALDLIGKIYGHSLRAAVEASMSP